MLWRAGWFVWLFVLLGLLPRGLAAELSVTVLSIGQGDAILVVSPTGKTVLIDGGPPGSGPRIVSALGQRRAAALDMVVLSHPHLDHLGGLPEVLDTVPVRLFLDAGYPVPSPAYRELLLRLAAHNVPVKNARAGRNIDLGDGATLTLLGPGEPFLQGTRSDVNANSIVARLSWRGQSALLTGDAEPETEQHLLGLPNGPAALRASLLKVAHHGGRYSSTEPFLRAVSPRLAFVSAGTGNDYGHPSPETLLRLAGVGAVVYRTDVSGHLTARSLDGGPWQVQTQAVESAPRSESPPSPKHGEAEAAYVGSVHSPVFHKASCPTVKRIFPANRRVFPNRAMALKSGRQPSGDCQP